MTTNTEMAPKVQVNKVKYKRRSGCADTQGQDFEVNLATLLFLRGINSGKSFLLGTNMECAEKFDDVIFKPEIGNSNETYFIQQKHKNRESIPIECLKSLQGDLSLFTYYKSFVQMKDNYKNSLVLQELGSFDSFKFAIYIDVGISNTDKYKKNANANLNSGNMGNSISFSPGDEIYTTFENWKSVKSFLENNHECTIKGNLNDLKKVVKNDAIIKEVEKSGKELEKIIGDLSLYKEFLSQVEIYSSQKNENLVEDIRKEIEIAFETSGDLTEKVFYKLRNSIKKYGELKGNQPFLNESEKFWENISSDMIAKVESLSQKKVSEFTAMNIHFEQSHLKYLDENLKNTQVLHILLPETMNMLSSLKAYQAVKYENFIFTDFNSLTDPETTLLEFWTTVWCKYLIVEDIESPKDITRLIGNVSNVLNKHKEKKLLLIGPKNGTLVSHLRSEPTIFHDNYNLTNLNSNSQKVILNKSVVFQGHAVPFHSIINTEESSMSLIRNDYLCQLVCSKDIKIGSELKKGLDSYIHRHLTRNIFVKDVEKLLNFPTHDFKIIVTATNSNVQYLIGGGTDNVSTGSENTHWFHRESKEKLVWILTKGDIESVYQFLDEENWRNFKPKTLTDIEDKIVLIVGKPGMGKTTLMNQLAIQTKQRLLKDPSKCKSVWIVQVNLDEHTSFLEKMKANTDKLNINTILEFLQGNVLRLDLEIEKQIFLHSMKKQGNVVIIFDAYDEISSTYGEQVIKILNELQKINKGRMYVTSRCKDRKKLEQELSTLAFTLQPFQKGEQQSYLECMWKLKYPNIDQIVLKDFVDRLLSLASRSICDKKKNFMSVPLQVMMLGEVYEDYIEKEIDLPLAIDLLQLYEQFVEKKLHILSTEKNKCDLSNPRMQRMWEREKQEFMENHKLSAMVSLFPEENLKTLKHFRKPTEFLSDIARGTETSEVIEDVIEGKPHFTHQTFAEYFAAVWFSENFELNTTFYIDHFLKSNYDVLKNIFDRVLVKGKDLHKAVLNNDKESIKFLLKEKGNVNDFDKGHRTALHLAVCLGNYSHNVADDDYSLKFSEFLYGLTPTENATDADHIVEILLKSQADVRIRDGILEWTPLKYADMYGSSFRTLGLLLEYNANPNELTETRKLFQEKKTKTDIEKYLEMAIQQGYTKLIEFMIDNGVDLKLPQEIVRVKKEYTTVVHKSVLYKKYGVVDMLVNKMPNIINIVDSNHNSALHLVSKEGNIESVEFLVDRKCDINPKNSDGDTPLHLAARIGHLHITQYLVEHGASVKALNNENYAAIHLAAHQGKLEVLRYLFEIQGKQFWVKDNIASTTPLHLAVRKGHKDIVKYLLEQDIDIDICDISGNSALHMTNVCNDTEMIKCLIDSGADVNKKNEKGETVIFWAHENGGIEILKYLNEKKADFNVKNNDDDTLLIYAGRNGKIEIVEYLSKLKTVDISVRNKNGNNVLHNAAQLGHIKLVSYLFNKFRRKLNNANKNYETPLLVAALHYKWDVVRLLEKQGANLYVKNSDGITVLHIASEQGNVSVVNWLLQKNVKMTIKTKKGDSILHFAARAGAQNILQYFSEKQQVDFETVNNSGDTLLHSAVRGNHIETVKYLLDLNIDVNIKNVYGKTPLHEAVTKSVVLLQMLLMAGANVDVQDKEGNTVLHLAASNEELRKTKLCDTAAHEDLRNAVKILINSGANLNIQNALRQNPLLSAIENKNSDFVKITLDTDDLDSALFIVSRMGLWTMLPDLLKKGVNLNTTAFCGITPLHVAAFANELDVVNYLLNKGAFIYQKSNKGITPLHFAAFKGNEDIVKLLLNKGYRGSGINNKDISGNTALHCAVISGSISVAKLLIMKGASIRIKNKKKKSPFDLAKSMKLREMEHLLHIHSQEAVDNFVDPSQTTYEVAR